MLITLNSAGGRHEDSRYSKIDCYLVKQTRHHGGGDNLCLLENVQLNMSVFADGKLTNHTVKVHGTYHVFRAILL